MDNYRCYLKARVWILSPLDRTCWKEFLHSLGASSGLSDGGRCTGGSGPASASGLEVERAAR
jgi:hypothetical protein